MGEVKLRKQRTICSSPTANVSLQRPLLGTGAGRKGESQGLTRFNFRSTSFDQWDVFSS